MDANLLAIADGGHVCVGLEDKSTSTANGSSLSTRCA